MDGTLIVVGLMLERPSTSSRVLIDFNTLYDIAAKYNKTKLYERDIPKVVDEQFPGWIVNQLSICDE